MSAQTGYRRQRGATLVVGLIMLTLLTLMVTSAFTLSVSHLKSVGNMQFRNEAVAAANKAIEQVVSSAFTTSPVAESINVDLNNDGTSDYVVAIAVPTCVRATVASTATLSSLSLGASMSSSSTWNTVWEIDATVTDAATGASVRTRSGIRVLRSQSQKDAECA
ncbi:MAG: PilX N-terminal domain-containing pilus assembly protein [Pseudomonadota bacterium]